MKTAQHERIEIVSDTEVRVGRNSGANTIYKVNDSQIPGLSVSCPVETTHWDIHATQAQRERVWRLRRTGNSFRAIASRVGLPLDTVRWLVKHPTPAPRTGRSHGHGQLLAEFAVGDRVSSKLHGAGYVLCRLAADLYEVGLEDTGELAELFASQLTYEPTEEEIYGRLVHEARHALETPAMAAKRAELGEHTWNVPTWPGMWDKELGSRE